jgi:hypothetical protein
VKTVSRAILRRSSVIVIAVLDLTLGASALSMVSCHSPSYTDKGDYARYWVGDYEGTSDVYVAATKTTSKDIWTTIAIRETAENKLSVTIRLYLPAANVHVMEFNSIDVSDGSPSLHAAATIAFQVDACSLSRQGHTLSGAAKRWILGDDEVRREVYTADPLFVTRR